MKRTPYVTAENLATKTAGWMEKISKRNVHKWPLDLDNAVLLVVDMQRYFLEEREHGYACGGVAVLSNAQKLISYFRERKRPVIYTQHAHHKDGRDAGILKKWWTEIGPIEGTPEAEIDPRVRPLAGEVVITKNRYSAFYNTNLEEVLKKAGVREIVMIGVMTNVCCESTARDAFFRDYMVRFVADATGTVEEEMHNATLLNLAYAFADVCTTEELMN